MVPGPRALLLCAAGAALLGLVPATLSYDPWGWMAWGEQAAHLELATGAGLSWKPLPVLVTTPLSLLGDIGPTLWLFGVRFCALLACVLAFGLAARLGGRTAGLIAVAGLLLVPDWMLYVAQGNLEPVLAALGLGAAAAWVEGRRRLAFGSLLLLSLARPEAWPVLGALAVALWRSEPRARLLAAAGAGAVALLWFAPDWLAAGEPLAAGGVARGSPEAVALQSADHPVLEALRRSLALLLPPLWAGVALLALATPRGARERAAALACLAWMGSVVVLAGLGYAGLGRFSLPAVAPLGALGAGALVAMLRAAGSLPRRVALAGALTLSLVPAALPAVGRTDDGWRAASDRARRLDLLVASVERAGGQRLVTRCGRIAVEGPFHTALAWRYRLDLDRLGDLRGAPRHAVTADLHSARWVVRAPGCGTP